LGKRQFIGEIPKRIAALPRDKRGFPIPKFVEWIDGEPDFRIMSSEHMYNCLKKGSCWICGETTGAHKAFVIGPMCCVNRVSAEPPSHYDCARFAALNCPFLSHPLAKRPDLSDIPDHVVPVGMIDRNPGVAAVWITKNYHPVRQGAQTVLMEIGDPERVEFYANGRFASREEIDKSVLTGLPILWTMAIKEGMGAERELAKSIQRFNETVLERFAPQQKTEALT